jgi:hypothetical protein
MKPAIARQVVALNFFCGPVLGAVSVALPLGSSLVFRRAGPVSLLHFLVGFALIMMFLNPREPLVKCRTGQPPNSGKSRCPKMTVLVNRD